MRGFKFLLLVIVFLPIVTHSQEDKRIDEIKAHFSAWQPIIEFELKNAPVIYKYSWGGKYEYWEWTTHEIKSDEKRLSERNMVIRKKNGSFVLREIYSFSGDWFIVSESYYDENGKLFFVLWRMNTFQAEEPATVERHLYFDKTGKIIRSLQDVYKMNTKQKQDISFMDREVEYQTEFKDSAFHEYLPKYP